jgi:hypothetical protein
MKECAGDDLGFQKAQWLGILLKGLTRADMLIQSRVRLVLVAFFHPYME